MEDTDSRRDPDIALTGFWHENPTNSKVLVSFGTSIRGGEIAHLPKDPMRPLYDGTQTTACGLMSRFNIHHTRHARWFAYGCPECFRFELLIASHYRKWQQEAIDAYTGMVEDFYD